MLASPLIGIIEDDEDVRLSLEDLLHSLGYRTKSFANADAYVHDEECRPDCVLSDVQMPGMSGIELTRHIRRTQPDLPVVLITAFPSKDIARQAADAGASSFLRKPFDPADLLACLERALRHPDD